MADEEERPREQSRLMKLKQSLSLTHKNATPLPWNILSLVFCVMFASCYSLTFVFSFLPEMTLYFGHAEEKKGYFAGLIASSVFAGRICSSYMLGKLTDIKGRKPVLVVSLILVCISNVAFGFCHNIWLACIVRFSNGFFNAIVIISKTILYEVSDNTNQAVSMSMVGLSWGSGIILGPLVSGYLVFPARRFPNTISEEGILGQFPFLLPCIVAALVSIVWVPLILWKLPETKARKKVPDITLEVDASDDTRNVLNPPTTAYIPNDLSEFDYIDNTDRTPLNYRKHLNESNHTANNVNVDITYNHEVPNKNHDSEDKDISQIDVIYYTAKDMNHKETRNGYLPNHKSTINIEETKSLQNEIKSSKKKTNSSCLEMFKKSTLVTLLKQKDVRDTVCIYSIISFAAVGWDEVFTVFSSTARYLDGLGFQPDQIGAALGFSSIPLIIIPVFLFPIMEKNFGAKLSFEIFCQFLIFNAVGIICLRVLVDRSEIFWPLLLILMGVNKLSQVLCFTACSLFINNSVPPKLTGSVNGIAMTATAILRTFAPTVGGSIFSWSLTNQLYFPLDINCVFLIFSAVYLISVILCAQMSQRLNKQKKDEN